MKEHLKNEFWFMRILRKITRQLTILLIIVLGLIVFLKLFLFIAECEYSRVHSDEEKIHDWIIKVHGKAAKNDYRELHISRVNLSGTDIENKDILHLVQLFKLENLILEKTQINDDAIQYINKLHTLKFLDLSDTRISQDGVMQLELPELVELNIPYPMTLDGKPKGCPKLRNVWNTSEDSFVEAQE